MRWLWKQRLEASRSALIEGRARNVTTAAYSSGFTDLSRATQHVAAFTLMREAPSVHTER
jgi:hypothetical protein